MSTDVTVWISAALTVAMLSMVFAKENPFYKLGVHMYIGIGMGHVVVMSFNVIKTTGWQPLVKDGKTILLVPLLLGLLLFGRFSKKVAPYARCVVSLILAVAAGLGIRGSVDAQFLSQIRATFISPKSLSDLVIIVGVVSTLAYFFFTKPYASKLAGPLAYAPRVGRWMMMLCFGASFASASAGFLSKLITRVMFLVKDWLGLIT